VIHLVEEATEVKIFRRDGKKLNKDWVKHKFIAIFDVHCSFYYE